MQVWNASRDELAIFDTETDRLLSQFDEAAAAECASMKERNMRLRVGVEAELKALRLVCNSAVDGDPALAKRLAAQLPALASAAWNARREAEAGERRLELRHEEDRMILLSTRAYDGVMLERAWAAAWRDLNAAIRSAAGVSGVSDRTRMMAAQLPGLAAATWNARREAEKAGRRLEPRPHEDRTAPPSARTRQGTGFEDVRATARRETSASVRSAAPDHSVLESARVASPPRAVAGTAWGDRVDLPESIRFAFVELRLDPTLFDPEWDRTMSRRKRPPQWRGGFPYRPAAGSWLRLGLRVSELTDEDSENWLGSDGGEGEWAVAYHGTRAECVRSIVRRPLRPGPRCSRGWGIYCSPEPGVAAEFAPPCAIGRARLQFVFQTRVNTSKICRCRTLTCGNDDGDATLHITTEPNFWFASGRNENYETIRCYALLVRVVRTW
jgi:hypothetical protein